MLTAFANDSILCILQVRSRTAALRLACIPRQLGGAEKGPPFAQTASNMALQDGGQLKTWVTTTLKADLEPLSGPRVFGCGRWRKDWVKDSSELAQDRRAWGASIRDVVNSIGDAVSTLPE